MKSAMLIAAEASSALFAQRIIEKWIASGKMVKTYGVGSDAMEALGFERFGRAEEMAVVGASEIIEHYGKLKSIFNQLVEVAKERRPDVVVLLDYPEFNLMLAKKLHALGLKVVYYITPQVWAWRKGRVKKIKKYCDKALVIFPFEVDFFQEHGVPVEFVGHPILDELKEDLYQEKKVLEMRRRCGIQDGELVLGLMPGSRKSELNHHLDLQLEVARRLYNKFNKIKILIMVAPSVDRDSLRDRLGDLRIPHIVMKEEPFKMIAMSDLVLAASGTATLMVALMHKPMVIMYRMSVISAWIAKTFVKGVKFFGLANLVLGKEVVPEHLQEKANADELEKLLTNFIQDPELYKRVKKELFEIDNRLGSRGATDRVVKALDVYLREENP